MTLVRFHRAATDEAEEAIRWYNKRVPGLGDDFRVELLSGVERIIELPLAWPVSTYDRRARRFLLARFPYAIVYVGTKDTVTVIAVAHAKRRPGYWRDR
ncbi:MAG: type II toxin-antitoxin system RelE/ParE family toxin [Myxococcota bacterium]